MKILLRLLVFARKYWRWLLLALICLLASSVFTLTVPRVLGNAIDATIGSGERSFLWIAAGIVLAATALRGLSEYGSRYFREYVSQKTSYDIRNAIYDKLQRLSFSYHDQSQTGQLMSRATVDVEAVRRFFGMGVLRVVEIIIMSIMVSWLLISINWELALLTLAFMPVIGWRTVVINRRLRPIWLKVQQLMGVLGTTLEENLIGIRIVKGFARQKEESRKFSGQATELYDQRINAARQMAINMPIILFLTTIPAVLIMWYGGRQVMAGSLTIGNLSEFIMYMGILAMPIRHLGMVVNIFSGTISSGQRIMEILDAQSPVEEKSGALELGDVNGTISFENVNFSYDSKVTALQDIDFNVKPGQLVALLGSSGSGKSTIANLICRFYDVTSGRITVDGVDIRDVTLSSLRRNIGAVQQDIFLFSSTVQGNIAYGATNADIDEVISAAKAAQLHDFIENLSEGYDTWVGERGINFSGGEKQRLAIARTLLINPKVLILDDSTSSVDAETEHLIHQALDKLVQGRTTFIITHRLPIIKSADLILVLDKGQIVERGKHDELITKDGLYRQIYDSQLSANQNSARDS
ncbi:ABC transporter ATP-binding protein [Chloroflexota bacterium]